MKSRKISNAQNILTEALNAVQQATGLEINLEAQNTTLKGQQIDALLTIKGAKKKLVGEVKNWAAHANLGALIHQIKNLPGEGILIADYVNPKMATALREQQVQFIDREGNAFINMPPVYVLVTGQRKHKPGLLQTKGETNRAFEPTGLKIIFALLCNPQLANAPYREIAEIAHVALGTVTWVMKGLKAAEFIREAGEKQRKLINRHKLLDRWVETYPEKLKPKQLIGKFVATDANWWKNIEIEKYNGYWGGEIAAAKYTNYLKPQVVTVYLPKEEHTNFMKATKLQKAIEWTSDDAKTVYLFEPFWNVDKNQHVLKIKKGIVPPILAYADLIGTGDSRNLEVAQRIYDKYIAEYIK